MKHTHLLLLLIASITYITATAQPTIKHQRTTGGNSDDVFQSIYLTRDGGLIAGGASRSNISGEKTENRRGPNYTDDYWVVKLDSLGKIQWDKTIGGSGEDFLHSSQQTSDGGYLLGGSSASGISGEKTENSRGSADYWVVKLNSSGNVEWDKTIGGSGEDVLTALEQTSDGGYILGGYSESNISGEKTENSRGIDDYWVIKLNSLGNVEWDKTIGGTGHEVLNALQQTNDGSYLIGGYSGSNISGEKSENSRGSEDYWVIKLNNAGNILWDKTIGGNKDDYLYCLQQTTDQGYVVGGYSTSDKSGEKSENSRGSADYWIVKLDSLGNIEMDKTYGGGLDDICYSLVQTLDEGYVLGGYSSSNISGEKTENSRGGADYWVVKLNSRGKIQWDKTIGGSGDDLLSGIKEVSQSRYMLGGSSGSGISGDKTQKLRGGSWDYWLVELKYIRQDSTAVATLPNANNLKATNNNNPKQFTIYPNPAKDILYIQANGKATVTFTDQKGKILISKTINNNGEINVANLAAGLYYLKNNTTGAVQKVVVTK